MIYLGGSLGDAGLGIAVDSADNALVTGGTSSTNFAGRNNSHYGGSQYDAFALKVSPSGELLWMTYLGGSGLDWGNGIAVDSASNVVVTGETFSTNFAGRNNAYYGHNRDAFIVKLRNCYADCDPSTGPGILDIFDFLCFGNRFAAADPYACDCDTSTGPGVCDIFDFLCFGNEFNAGCP
jgi:hypothetical protein